MEMPTRVNTADSLIGSLCREAEASRQRCRQLQQCLQRCQDSRLFARLQRELDQLQQRRLELLSSARACQRRGSGDPLVLAFLIELCNRPLA
jgi:hypothetical protein